MRLSNQIPVDDARAYTDFNTGMMIYKNAELFPWTAAIGLGEKAKQTDTWQFHADCAPPREQYRHGHSIGAVAAIAAPTGQVVVGFAHIWITPAHRDRATKAAAAKIVTGDAMFASQWHARAVTHEYAAAVGRVLHAVAFDYRPAPFDALLAHLAHLPAKVRPPIGWVKNASPDQRDAAVAALMANAPDAARALLKPIRGQAATPLLDWATMPTEEDEAHGE